MKESQSARVRSPHRRLIVLLAHVGFVLVGVVNTLLRPILPFLSARWQHPGKDFPLRNFAVFAALQ